MREGAIGSTAFLFPGQGSQFVGMGKDLYETVPQARQVFQLASDILGFDIAAVAFEGPEEELKQTRVTQPAIFIHSVIVTHLLRERGLTPDMAAGHSLGEYSALVCAGAIELADGLRLVKVRAEAMQRAGEQSPGTMAAVIGAEKDLVESICREVTQTMGVVEAANFNSPGQIAISGTPEAVKAASERLLSEGARKVVPLVVSGAFHSSLMGPAQQAVAAALAAIEIRPARIPVYANVTAEPVTQPEQIRHLLEEQLVRPVRWVETIQNMIAGGATSFYEVGPGSVLTGLLRRIDRSAECTPVGTLTDLESIA